MKSLKIATPYKGTYVKINNDTQDEENYSEYTIFSTCDHTQAHKFVIFGPAKYKYHHNIGFPILGTVKYSIKKLNGYR